MEEIEPIIYPVSLSQNFLHEKATPGFKIFGIQPILTILTISKELLSRHGSSCHRSTDVIKFKNL